MPRRTIWVREDDVDAFDAIENRPKWLHEAIKSTLPVVEKIHIRDLSPEMRTALLGQPSDAHYEPSTYIDESEMM